jgi:hypothetical protein
MCPVIQDTPTNVKPSKPITRGSSKNSMVAPKKGSGTRYAARVKIYRALRWKRDTPEKLAHTREQIPILMKRYEVVTGHAFVLDKEAKFYANFVDAMGVPPNEVDLTGVDPVEKPAEPSDLNPDTARILALVANLTKVQRNKLVELITSM